MFVAAMSCVLVACNDNNESGNVVLKPIFDTPLRLSCAVNESKEINFTSDTEWKLVSGAIWCRLSLDGENFSYSVSGKKGANTILVKVGDEAAEFCESATELKIIRQNNEETIATVLRAPEKYLFSIVAVEESEEKELQSIAMNENGSVTFNAYANFNFGITEIPEWLSDITVSKIDNNPYRRELSLKVLSEYEPFKKDGRLKFEDEGANASFVYDIVYPGMNPRKIQIEGDAFENWTLSGDGSTFSNKNAVSGKEILWNDSVVYNVKALNYDCRYLFLQEDGENLLQMTDEDGWLAVTQNSDSPAEVYVTGKAFPENMEGSRKGYVFAFPAAINDSIMELYAAAPDLSFIDTANENLMMAVIQVSDYVDLTKGFSVLVDDEATECFKESDKAMISMVNSLYDVSEVYAVSADSDAKITAYTNLTYGNWSNDDMKNIAVLDATGNIISDPVSAIGLELVTTADNEQYFTLTAQAKPVVVLLLDDNGECVKALVIKSSIVLNPGTGFEIKNMITLENVECNLESDIDFAAALVKRYGTKEIYTVCETVGYSIYIYPQLSLEEWNVESTESVIIADADGATIKPAEVKLECGEDPDNEGYYYATLVVKNRVLVVVFVGTDGANKKILVVRPK